jgi:hypothetical protein
MHAIVPGYLGRGLPRLAKLRQMTRR